MAARPGRPPLPDFSDPLAPTCWRRRSGCGAPAGRGGHHHQVLTLRACSIFPAGGGAGQAGVVLDLLQAFAWARCCTLVRSRSTRCCCYRPAPAARIRLWSSCRARWPPPGADAARVLDLPRRRRCRPGRRGVGSAAGVRLGALLHLSAIEVDQVLLLSTGAGGADPVVELLQGAVATTRC